MKLKDLLIQMYSQNPEERDLKSSVRYAYKYLSYLDEGNELLTTDDVLHWGEKRLQELTGEEVIEQGFYTLWSGAHDGIEWLQRFDSYEEALENQTKWNDIKFSGCDFCAILEVE